MRNAILFLALLPLTVAAQSGYVPDDAKLYREIIQRDSLFFDAYNHCETKLATYAGFYADDLEFYHDKGGFSNSKKETVDATKRNICGKVTRHLKPGSIEVYPIKDWGAIELGEHQFRNKSEPDAAPHYSKFIIFWRNDNGRWTITKVVSLH